MLRISLLLASGLLLSTSGLLLSQPPAPFAQLFSDSAGCRSFSSRSRHPSEEWIEVSSGAKAAYKPFHWKWTPEEQPAQRVGFVIRANDTLNFWVAMVDASSHTGSFVMKVAHVKNGSVKILSKSTPVAIKSPAGAFTLAVKDELGKVYMRLTELESKKVTAHRYQGEDDPEFEIGDEMAQATGIFVSAGSAVLKNIDMGPPDYAKEFRPPTNKANEAQDDVRHQTAIDSCPIPIFKQVLTFLSALAGACGGERTARRESTSFINS
uniref:GOLD domain-containing protein n=1 Tax=Chromera velia CCMP2878 TaxID=1169474 RepID=A0A0G4I4A5_9ALVE|eukprot:Cvel_10874.t1-p1 / transcript=Cvel_10874.t1 / gene=Cvel_10874 / organism=Chromera_velia_CCMP2878 / gene_product=hypothetical protein / transcript_product=hypothetical protein / location=Cvel_scaffold666:42286-43708(+) / protein_length=265 / sequence_SO=supercontig / SO=protein_coding / is_pseudo=false